ncbi:MAG: PrsW family intramembrane metalloprotease [Clostridiales bacterium]|nr:PrsW family intramembrane metalloprotease [Clostridiales bacterium]MBQ6270725.1 PrsW family intramembrane metalloprotease [Clostridiales bacterium]
MIYAENVLICIAVPLVISLLFTKRSTRRFIVSFMTGMIVCLLSAYISGYLAVSTSYSTEEASIFLSPIVEEIMKFLPVLFCFFVFEPSPEDLKPTAVGVGAGFATFENCCFILSSGASHLGYVMIRGLAVGVMHLVTMVAFVMGLRLLKRYKVVSFAGIVGALSMSMTFHGLYNLLVSEPGVSSYIGYALPMLFAVMLYLIGYRPVAGDDEDNL